MLQEFKAFAMKGNVIDLAVAVVIGAAFGKIVSALVNNMITPLVGMVVGGVDFSSLSFSVGEAVFGYGAFIQASLDFVIVAFVLFIVIKTMNKAQKVVAKEEEPVDVTPAGPTDNELLSEIRDLLRK